MDTGTCASCQCFELSYSLCFRFVEVCCSACVEKCPLALLCFCAGSELQMTDHYSPIAGLAAVLLAAGCYCAKEDETQTPKPKPS